MEKQTQSHTFRVGEFANGFVSVSSAEPYFCFVGASEEEAVLKARAALDFFHSNTGEVMRRTPLPARTVTPVRLDRDLLCA